MKNVNYYYRFLILLIIPILLSNCKTDNNNNDKVGTANVTAIVDGNIWQSSSDSLHSSVGAVGLINTSLNIAIQAYGADESYIALNVVSMTDIIETTYTSDNGEFQGQYKQDFVSSDAWASILGSGTLTFTNINSENITGTFSFNGVHPTMGSVSVDNGNFDVDL